MSLYELEGKRPQTAGAFWVADTARVIGDVHLGPNASVWYGAVLRGDNEPIVIGEDSNVQEHAVGHTDPGKPLVLGRGVTVGHAAVVHGCTIGDYALIGIGATVLNGARVGAESLIGAGALVLEGAEIPPRSMVLGMPAKVVRPLTDAEVQGLHLSAEHYVNNARRFLQGLKKIQQNR